MYDFAFLLSYVYVKYKIGNYLFYLFEINVTSSSSVIFSQKYIDMILNNFFC